MTRDEQIAYLASLMFTRKEIQVIMDGSEDLILASRLKSEAELRQSIFSLAKNGSGPAQTQAMKFIEEMKMKELDDDDD